MVYEITLHSPPPSNLPARFSTITLQPAPTVTVLSKRVADPVEVDWLTERLRSLGITPLEVRASLGRYEFRIQGRLGRSILRYLQWAWRFEQERTVVRVSATPEELREILEQLAGSGLQVDRCVRCKAA
ncbi:MAG TPA: hypothetical protein VJ625_09225 [Propionibacteriaceae bacterium]|nr:hypothetical protein [Propionibacteriaceae bacterium]